MVQGSWVGNPLFFFLFTNLLFISYKHINCPGWGKMFHPQYFEIFFLSSSFLLVSFLGFGAWQSCISRSKFSYNK